MLVWSVQNQSISSKICLENSHKIGHFLPIAFWWSLLRKLPWNSCEIGQFFCEFVPKYSTKFDFVFHDLSEALTFAGNSAPLTCDVIDFAMLPAQILAGNSFIARCHVILK